MEMFVIYIIFLNTFPRCLPISVIGIATWNPRLIAKRSMQALSISFEPKAVRFFLVRIG